LKKIWKKNIAILLIVALVLAIMPIAVFAGDGGTEVRYDVIFDISETPNHSIFGNITIDLECTSGSAVGYEQSYTYPYGSNGGYLYWHEYLPSGEYTYTITAETNPFLAGFWGDYIYSASGVITESDFGENIYNVSAKCVLEKAGEPEVKKASVSIYLYKDNKNNLVENATVVAQGKTDSMDYIFKNVGNYTLDIPNNQDYTVTITAPCEDNAYEYKKILEISADKLAEQLYLKNVILTDNDKVLKTTTDQPQQMTTTLLFVDGDHDNAVMQGYEVYMAVEGTDAYQNAKTDEQGMVTFDLPLAEAYLLKIVVPKDNIEYGMTVTRADLEKVESGQAYQIVYKTPKTPERLQNVTVTTNVCVGEDVYRTNTTKNYPFSIGSVQNVSGALYEGLTQCSGAKVSLNGTIFDAKQYQSDKINNYGTKENPVFYLNAGDNSPQIMLNTKNLSDNDKLEIDFYYDYIDQDKNYTLTIQHEFYAENNAMNLVAKEVIDPLQLKAGEKFAVNAQTSVETPYIKKNITGYRSGTWYLGAVRLEGGQHNSFKGAFDSNEVAYTVSQSMIHSNAALVFQYYYRPADSLQYAYQVTRNYFVRNADGTLIAEDSVIGDIIYGNKDEVINVRTADYANYDNKVYIFDSGNTSVTLTNPLEEMDNKPYEVILNYVRTMSSGSTSGGGGSGYDGPYSDDPTPSTPSTEIPDQDVPLAKPDMDRPIAINDPDVPLADVPDETVELEDSPVPLGDAPATGDRAPIGLLAGMLFMAAGGFVTVRRKGNE